MGLFNTAEAFRLSAMALQRTKVDSGFAEMPVRHLYFHALELYLKALLRQTHSVAALSSRKFGHKTERLVKAAEALGLAVKDDDREVFSLIDANVVTESRYIKTGAKTWPATEALCRTCKNVRDGVGRLLRRNDVMVRL
jgi:hypothetical protein